MKQEEKKNCWVTWNIEKNQCWGAYMTEEEARNMAAIQIKYHPQGFLILKFEQISSE